MIDATKQFIADFAPYGHALHRAAQTALNQPNGRIDPLGQLIEYMPNAHPSFMRLDQDCVTIGRSEDLTTAQTANLTNVLKGLKPWRKGPFNLFGIHINSEWNCALKWRRVSPHIKPIQNRKILDVGSSNGYYLFRMTAAQPKLILGIEPYSVYFFQFMAMQRYLRLAGTYCLPLKLEDLPKMNQWFDTIFCMGILYHRRSPLDTLSRMKDLLTSGGQLILETLIIPGENDSALFPRNRYARMRNVFFLPTVRCLQNWLERSKFRQIRCVDITPTTLDEQRKTPWIDSESLEACIDPCNNKRTVEGYPAPIRAIMIAEKP